MTPQQLKALLPVNKNPKLDNVKKYDNEKLYTIYELGNYYGVSGDTIRCYITAHKIQCRATKPSQIGFYRYYKLEDLKDYRPNKKYNSETKKYIKVKIKSKYKTLTILQRIKLLFGIDI
jgi:hypothetical protein